MSECPSLTADRWMTGNEAEFSRIRSQAIGDLQRASRGIVSIARLLHNSIGDDMDGLAVTSIDDFTKQNMAGAVECLGDFMYQILGEAVFAEAEIEELAKGARHG